MEIHPTAVVSPGAELAEDVIIRPYSVIGPHVKIGSGSVIGPHAVIDGWTSIGARNQVFPFSTIGGPPQDLGYSGEETRLVLGDDNVIRENVTISRGTVNGGGVTVIGNRNLFMAYAHVAHDCKIGDRVILANATTLAGHVQIDDCAILGGMVAIHQFVRIGRYSFIGGMSGLRMDMPPFMLAFGAPAKLYGPNLVGLKRNGFSPEAIQLLKKSYRIIFRSGLSLKDAVEKIEQEVGMTPDVQHLVEFMQRRSKRGITRDSV
ncbi:MAG: acyl-ACP--UDP-N-acetylglucosamine O-acyltransferase [Deltaproteobacteria bacterium]|nr:acyl-ACP--UDP-N-acetylglucosamine O-acyltransferase [Deltaproteobacteria bacterium]